MKCAKRTSLCVRLFVNVVSCSPVTEIVFRSLCFAHVYQGNQIVSVQYVVYQGDLMSDFWSSWTQLRGLFLATFSAID